MNQQKFRRLQQSIAITERWLAQLYPRLEHTKTQIEKTEAKLVRLKRQLPAPYDQDPKTPKTSKG